MTNAEQRLTSLIQPEITAAISVVLAGEDGEYGAGRTYSVAASVMDFGRDGLDEYSDPVEARYRIVQQGSIETRGAGGAILSDNVDGDAWVAWTDEPPVDLEAYVRAEFAEFGRDPFAADEA